MDEATTPEESPVPHKPYHAKRPHKKSRAGCKSCKARKVKCDEVRPACRSCRLRNTDCVYITNSSSRSGSSDPSSSHSQPGSVQATPNLDHHFSFGTLPLTPESALVPLSSRDASPAPSILIEPLFRPPSVDAVDMKLLWFYTTQTCSSFSVRDAKWPVGATMRDVLVPYAFETPFLMDSILALSCLHLQNLNGEVDKKRALKYRVRSFEGYRKAVEAANPKTFPAIGANSLLLTALSSESFRDPEADELYILDWIVVWKGIGRIIDLVQMPSLINSGLNFLFVRPSIDLEKSTAFIPARFLSMIASIPADDPDSPFKDIYLETLKYIGSLYMHLKEGLGALLILRIITIFTFVPNEFIELARMRRPRALVLIAYCATFTKLIQDDVWWYAQVGQHALRGLCNFLGPDWEHHLKTPLAAIKCESRMEIARLLLEDPFWISEPRPQDMAELERLCWVDDLGRRMRYDVNNGLSLMDHSISDKPMLRYSNGK